VAVVTLCTAYGKNARTALKSLVNMGSTYNDLNYFSLPELTAIPMTLGTSEVAAALVLAAQEMRKAYVVSS